MAPERKKKERMRPMAYRILLVDDEHQLRRMVGEILEQEGYAVLLAADCAQGETLFCREQPDAVLLDVMLPDGDGFSLFQKLRAVRDVPVLFLSARDEDEARLRGLGLGADDYITKPFLPQELLLRLAAVLRRVYGGGQKNTGHENALRLGSRGGRLGRRGGAARGGEHSPDRKGVRPAAQALGKTAATSSRWMRCAPLCGTGCW